MTFYRIQRWLKYLALKQGIKRTGMIKRTGILTPVLITKDGVIVDGRTRNRVAKELGIQIPVIVLPFQVEYRDPNDLVDLLDEVGGRVTDCEVGGPESAMVAGWEDQVKRLLVTLKGRLR